MTSRRHRARRALGMGLLLPGLLLVDSGPAHAEVPARAAQKRSPPREPRRADPVPRECVHVVGPGDSVSRIALRQRVTRQALIDANRLSRPDALRVGQRLRIPGCAARGPEGAPAAARRAPAGAVAPGDGALLAAVGPRRVPTRLFLGVPELNGRGIDLAWPVLGPVLSGFGRRRSGWHAGIDIRAEVGTPIRAAAPGTVYASGWERSYGRVVRIEHDHGFRTVYAHNLQNLVEAGDRVEAGTVIGTVGRSGRATAHHLHFEVRHEGMVYNPLFLLPPRDVILARGEEAPEPPEEDDEEADE